MVNMSTLHSMFLKNAHRDVALITLHDTATQKCHKIPVAIWPVVLSNPIHLSIIDGNKKAEGWKGHILGTKSTGAEVGLGFVLCMATLHSSASWLWTEHSKHGWGCRKGWLGVMGRATGEH